MSKKSNRNNLCIEEEVKIAVNVVLERFRLSEDLHEYAFPSSFTSVQRAYVHKLCINYGFKSFSKGKGINRYLIVSKNNASATKTSSSTHIQMVRNSKQQIQSLLQKFPLSMKERQELQQKTERTQTNEGLMKEIAKSTAGRLSSGVPQVPPSKTLPPEFATFQESLPISGHKQNIVKMINDNKVIIVVGETGSGKTTQIPQMILDDCQANNKACRIFCTQPRRLAVLTIAQRVAAERGEKIGETIGYQIRLESKVSPKTILTFCTNGVLLRTLMSGDQATSYVTHILVDEVHERDRFCDFMLLSLRELLTRSKHLRIVLMSANLNTQLFSTYFNNCPILSLPGRLHEVEDFYLEDVLRWTAYMSAEMEKKKKQSLATSNNVEMSLDEWCKWGSQPPSNYKINNNNINININNNNNRNNFNNNAATVQPHSITRNNSASSSNLVEAVYAEKKEVEELEGWMVAEMDAMLAEAWLSGREEVLMRLINFILNENIIVDYRHSELGVTALMVAAGRGFLAGVDKLLGVAASTHLRSNDGLKALDWARKFDQTSAVELIEAYSEAAESGDEDDTRLLKLSDDINDDDRQALGLYHSTFDDDRVDLDLVVCLLSKIHSLPQPGAILVFLPGYDDIMQLREKILDDKDFSESSRYILYTLHSQMQSSEQKGVFTVPEQGVRKIILSTNIAESSITINDVVFIVDSGKVKMKSFDAISSISSLKSQWISKASVLQRSGRAGRCQPGKAYHLFSRARYQHMEEYPVAEILRFPLQELCLHTKLLAPMNCKIADFLAKAPEPPAFLVVKNAVHHLKQIEALDPFEDLTELGHHLADLPIEPKYGKMILYSIVLKCLDPILTIACSLAYKDPFLLPSQPYQKKAVAMSRRRFASGTYSDHMALLRAFQGWQKARSEGWEKSFCLKNFLSSPTMEMIVAMRTQLLGQLRAAGFVRARGNGDIRDVNYNSENWAVVKAALCAGVYPNLLKTNKETGVMYTSKESKVLFHNASVLSASPHELPGSAHKASTGTGAGAGGAGVGAGAGPGRLPTEWILFEEMTRRHRTFHVRTCTAISAITAAIFAGPSKLPNSVITEAENSAAAAGLKLDENGGNEEWQSDSGEDEDDKGDECSSGGSKSHLNIDDTLKFSFEGGMASLVLQLRLKWHFLFLRRMKTPTRLWSTYDESSIRTLVTVLSNEEMSLGLQQPSGIGQRPRPMSNESTILSGGSKDASTLPAVSCSMTLSLSNMVLLSDSSSSTSAVSSAAVLRSGGGGLSIGGSGGDGIIGNSGGARGSSTKQDDQSKDIQRKMTSLKLNPPGLPPNPGTTTLISKAPNQPPLPYQSTQQQQQQQQATRPPQPPAVDRAAYFIVLTAKSQLLNVAEYRNVWPAANSHVDVFAKYLMEGREVYLVFTVEGTGCFLGYARVLQLVNNFFMLDWIKTFSIQFSQCQSIFSSLYEKKLISTGEFQEIDVETGEELLRLWNKQPASLHLPQNPLLLEPVNQESIWSSNPRKITQQNNIFNNNNNNPNNNNNSINNMSNNLNNNANNNMQSGNMNQNSVYQGQDNTNTNYFNRGSNNINSNYNNASNNSSAFNPLFSTDLLRNYPQFANNFSQGNFPNFYNSNK